MKFKIDENLPIEAAQSLSEAGYDALTVHDQNMVGEKDTKLAQVCRDELRVLVTLDMHFADIRAYPPVDFPGLIVLRLTRQDKQQVLNLLRRTIKLLKSEMLHGKLWIVEEKRVRVRS